MKLSGSWEVIVGEQDTFCESSTLLRPWTQLTEARPVHILEYENYAGYDKTVAKIRQSDVRSVYVSGVLFILMISLAFF